MRYNILHSRNSVDGHYEQKANEEAPIGVLETTIMLLSENDTHSALAADVIKFHFTARNKDFAAGESSYF